jgi:two-component system, OmpR family, sensor histidine kinase SenX3
MRVAPRRPTLAFAVVAILLALLPVLAIFQFRWLGKVSEAERERLQTSLRSSAAELSEEFDRELARVYTGLGMAPETLDAEAWEQFAAQFDRWAATALHPTLVRDIFLTRRDADGERALNRFDRGSRTFVACEWDPRLAGIRESMAGPKTERGTISVQSVSTDEQGTTRHSTAERSRVVVEPFTLPRRLGPIDYDVPAVVIPVDKFDLEKIPVGADGGTGVFMKRIASDESVIVVLDERVIFDEIVPELVGRHFGIEAGNDCDVAVRDGRRPSELLFSTDPALDAAAFDSSEITEPFFTVSPADIAAVAGVRVPLEAGAPLAVPSDARRFGRFQFKIVEGTSSGPIPDRLFLAEEGGWLVAVRHRAGSLDAAVEAIRLRNIAISFGILLVLAVSVVMLVVSSQRAQRLARRQMEFVAGVSHELRTPLTVICSAAENLAHGVVASERQVKQYGALIEGEGRRLAEMVEQVLEYAGAESGKTRYSVRAVDVREVVEAAVRASEPFLSDAGLRVEVDVAEPIPDVEGDPNALQRAVQNLLGNAVKYAAEGGVVSVSARPDGEPVTRVVLLSVADRGPGIGPDDLPHLFEPFYRGRAALDAQIHGSGLGLNLVKRVAEAHGGSVRVESVIGHGSTFTLRLPVSTAARRDEVLTGRSYEQAHPTG